MKAPEDFAGAGAEPIFTPEETELLAFRRFNPLASLNAASLTSALDSYLSGYLMPAARLWDRLAKQQKTIRNVKGKREEAVALRARVIERENDTPEAFDQAAVLEHFYRNARAGHALNRDVNGGFSKIVMQMMEAKSFGTAAHHLIWTPNSSKTFALPSGKLVPSLTAKFEYVPMEFFESRTGQLRFLGSDPAWNGTDLAPNSWLVTSEEAPLMFAGCVLAYYDKIATADLINFSDKFGTPGLVIHTTAQRGTPEGESARKLAQSLASNYRGVEYGAKENKVEIIWPSGGTSGTALPMHTIIEDCKRDLASLWLGADLSTQSRGNESVGASVQQEGEERRERADCAWISETLNAGIDAIVIRWYFGDVPQLARVVIDAPKNEDLTALTTRVQAAVGLGAQVQMEPVLKRLNIPQAKAGETVFEPQKPETGNLKLEEKPLAINVDRKPGAKAESVSPDAQLSGKFLARSRDLFFGETAGDLSLLAEALENVLAAPDFTDAAQALYDQLPDLAETIIPKLGNAKALYEILSTAAAEGLATEDAENTEVATNANSNHDAKGRFAASGGNVFHAPDMGGAGGTVVPIGKDKVGREGEWDDLGLPDAKGIPPVSGPKPARMNRSEALAKLGVPYVKQSPLGDQVKFDSRIQKHLADDNNDSRPEFLSHAERTVEQPAEIWQRNTEKGPRRFHIGIFKEKDGTTSFAVVAHRTGEESSRVVSVVPKKLTEVNNYRHGKLVYAGY